MYQKILVPIDGSDASMRGLNEAIMLAKDQGGQLRLFHIVNEFVLDTAYSIGTYAGDLIETLRVAGEKIVREAEALVRQHGLEPDTLMQESIGGPAAALIVKQARDWPADLIVMGTHGRRGLRRLAMGSDAENVVREATIPVLLVHCVPTAALPTAKVKAPADASMTPAGISKAAADAPEQFVYV